MQNTIIFAAIFACATAAPALLLSHDTELMHTVPLAKSTITKSSQAVDHGSTLIHTPVLPVVHTSLVHTPVVPVSKSTVTKSSQVVNHGGTAVVHSVSVVPLAAHAVQQDAIVHAAPSKTTVTRSNQFVNHGSTLIHSNLIPVHTAPVLTQSAPVLVHPTPLFHSSPLLSLKTGDSAVSHHSSTVHETVPVVKSLPYVSLYH
ncbi:uncharacterized protein LOC113520947 [Galleria mellonella]|uniref:Uncharacterized protein LOC113520947 n=1 Tax=Galleria mellonella TaxID=7137 RepID=A0ABM3MT50_GALME|nr:uncharacterized protein LOC113520947 [Galleria mellonella]